MILNLSLLIYVAFDGLFSHCGGQNSNKNPLEQLNIALLKQIFGWRNIWLLFGIFGEISLQSSGHTDCAKSRRSR